MGKNILILNWRTSFKTTSESIISNGVAFDSTHYLSKTLIRGLSCRKMVFMAFSETEPKIFAAEMHRCLAALSFAKIDVEEDGDWWLFGGQVWLSGMKMMVTCPEHKRLKFWTNPDERLVLSTKRPLESANERKHEVGSVFIFFLGLVWMPFIISKVGDLSGKFCKLVIWKNQFRSPMENVSKWWRCPSCPNQNDEFCDRKIGHEIALRACPIGAKIYCLKCFGKLDLKPNGSSLLDFRTPW